MSNLNLREMSVAELRMLNKDIVSEIKFRNDLDNQKAKAQFRVGDKVYFDGKRGRVHGEITKINPKTIHVKSGFTTWRVSPTFLRIDNG